MGLEGITLYDDDLVQRMKAGRLYVAIQASHTDKPILKRVRLPVEPPNTTEE